MKIFNLAIFLGLAVVGQGVAVQGQVIDMVKDMGAFADGTNATANITAFRNAFTAYPNGKIIVPPGSYAIDNSQGPLFINNFNGELKFEGNAVLLFQNNVQGGFQFIGGTGTRIEGMHGNYPNNPTTRADAEFTFTNSVDIVVKDATAENSPGAAFIFTTCIRPKAINITATNALADGLIFANSQDAQLVNITTEHTLDNGVALYNYEMYQDLNGATLTNVNIHNAYAHGLAIVGTSNVVVSGFVVDTTRGSAVYIGPDPTYQIRPNKNATLQHGYVRNSGTLTPPGGTTFGLEYAQTASVFLSDIQVEGSAGRSVSGTGVNTTAYLRHIRTKNNTSSDDFVFFQTGFVDISDCVSENSVGAGFVFDSSPTVIARGLKVINASKQNSLHRAIWFKDANYVGAGSLLVVDNQPTPTGFVVGTSNSPGITEKGSIQGLVSAIPSGSLNIQNFAASVNITDVN